MRSAIILAGGNSSRFGGEKAFYPFRGKALIGHVYERVSGVCGDVVVVVRDKSEIKRYESLLDCKAVADLEAGRGPLMGMYSGLLSVRGEESLIVGTDMPFLDPGLMDFLFNSLSGYDAVVPRLDEDMLEPLLSAYLTKPAAAACKKSLSLGRERMVSALDFLRVRYIPVAELKNYGPKLESLVNINSRKDLDAVER